MSIKKTKSLLPSAPALLGLCSGVIVFIPVAAMIASVFGNTYNTRVLIYAIELFWFLAGIVWLVKYFKTPNEKQMNIKTIFLWFCSLWCWPVLFLYFAIKKK